MWVALCHDHQGDAGPVKHVGAGMSAALMYVRHGGRTVSGLGDAVDSPSS